MVVTYKDGHEMLSFALHAYCTAVFSSVWDEGGDAFGSRNPLVKGVDGFITRRGCVGQNEI